MKPLVIQLQENLVTGENESRGAPTHGKIFSLRIESGDQRFRFLVYIGADISYSFDPEFTVKIQRRGVMQKMRARSLAELVRMAEKLGIPFAKD